MCVCHVYAVVITAVLFTGESCPEEKIEADSNAIAERPLDDKPRPYLCTVCDKRFTRKPHLKRHELKVHREAESFYSSTQSDERFANKQRKYVRRSKYLCTECGKIFSSLEKLTVHEQSHSDDKPLEDDNPRRYFCTLCDKQLTTERRLERHKLKTHSEEGDSCSCPQCGKRLANRRYLRQHMNVHSSKYLCTECGKCFGNKPKLTIHERSHSGERPYQCAVCGKQFACAGKLSTHRRIHNEEKQHKCQLCDKAYSDYVNLTRHVRIVHTGERPFKCHVCEKTFGESGVLKVHLRVHAGNKPYKCSECDASFSQSAHLQRHKLCVHGDRKPNYSCRYCEKLFTSSRTLKCHVRIHTGVKPYSCTRCPDTFARPDLLTKHLLKSHDEGTWLSCDTCGQLFSRGCDLNRHVLHHAAVKPYLCSQCPRSFYTPSEVKAHETLHADVKRFCCGFCGKFFSQKSFVTNHLVGCSRFVERATYIAE